MGTEKMLPYDYLLMVIWKQYVSIFKTIK